ncbi:MFS transporter [Corynebacterium sp. p3-SID1145]|uniref:MFS transporter n=1 Tax=unclassified Corynebacterium TaxID=2624378 RepID=UPI0021A98DB4|nr:MULTISPECIES: MFS transporter [unclassified Corynebacterium]MCT1452577.1 MFS transporter [Corynebacterium sp. p3-SID1145]MCT1461479.1 MFS transporter [Corynebacterium sp. p3-SID1140]
MSKTTPENIFKQPVAVWAIAFACAVSFMGIGLVDPILPAISRELDASPTQTMLLFTSYLLITALAMFFSSFISSRIGVKQTLLAGLALIVVFAFLSGTAGSVDAIIGFRAGWGLGNALFISTALAAIVGAASGGPSQAVILYEAAMGIGMAVGPLVGGVLGEISWRGPFYGTAALMAVGFLAIAALLRKPARKPEPVSFVAGFKALREPALLTLGAVAFFYNYGFFTLLAYSPYPIDEAAEASGSALGATELGYVFFGWGLALALSSVFVAPRLTQSFGLMPVICTILVGFAVLLVGLGFGVDNLTLLIVLVIVAGIFIGIFNTVLTEAVMEATDLPRNVASSTYSGLRFLGGAIAPAVSGPLATAYGAGVPYWAGAATLVVSLVILFAGRSTLTRIL